MIFESSNQPAIVLQPGEQPLHLPTSLVASQGPAVLCLRFGAIAFVRGDQRHALVQALKVQRVAVVGLVADEPFGPAPGQATVDQVRDEPGLVRRSAARA